MIGDINGVPSPHRIRYEEIRARVTDQLSMGCTDGMPIIIDGMTSTGDSYPIFHENLIAMNTQAIMDGWDPNGPTIKMAKVFLEGLGEGEHGSWDIETIFGGLWFMSIYETVQRESDRWTIDEENPEATVVAVSMDAHVRLMQQGLLRAYASSVCDFIIACHAMIEETAF